MPVCTHVCRCGGSVIVPKPKEYTVFHPAYPDSGGDGRLQALSAVSGVCHDGWRGTGAASYDDRHCGILCAQSIPQGQKNIKAAKSDLKELHKVAKKSVKKNKKSRIKNEAKEAKLAAKQVKRETKAAIKEQKRQNKLAKKQARYELKEKKRQQKSERVELKHELKKTQLMDKVRRFTPKEQNSESTSSAESIDNNITENNIIENNIIDIERKVN